MEGLLLECLDLFVVRGMGCTDLIEDASTNTGSGNRWWNICPRSTCMLEPLLIRAPETLTDDDWPTGFILAQNLAIRNQSKAVRRKTT